MTKTTPTTLDLKTYSSGVQLSDRIECLGIMEVQLRKPREYHSTLVLKGSSGALNWVPNMLRAPLAANVIFFQSN